MTPPDNVEPDTDITTSSGSASPPWQRVVRDGNGSSAAGENGEPTSEVSSDAAARIDALARGNDATDQMAHTGEQPVVTGTAAQGMYGNSSAPTEYFPQPGAAKGAQMDGVDLGTRGRSAPSALRRPGRGPRRASLMVKRVDPWSVLKLSLVLGVAMFLVWMVAVGLLYIVLDGMGVWDKLNGTYTSMFAGEGTDAAAEPLISAGRVFGVAAIIGMVNIVLLSALATVSSFIYNVSADLAGGLEITLSERD